MSHIIPAVINKSITNSKTKSFDLRPDKYFKVEQNFNLSMYVFWLFCCLRF